MADFYVEIRGRAAIWIGGLVFTLVGSVITFLAPQFLQSTQDASAARLILVGLGGVFLLFGLGSLGVGIGDVVLSRTNPTARQRWMWWGNFLLGIGAAAVFAVPASLAFPLLLVAYLSRPNVIFPSPLPDANGNLTIGLIITLVGFFTLAMIIWVARRALKSRPR
ncbi:MAG: hypothetical protein P8Z00_18190 [Anaerolineales bacterium]|jgi:hypothetical protein